MAAISLFRQLFYMAFIYHGIGREQKSPDKSRIVVASCRFSLTLNIALSFWGT